MEKKIIICQGLPGSGKSTWAKQYVLNNPEFMRLNKDEIREQFVNVPYSQEFEEDIISIQRTYACAAINCGKSLIIDDSNFNTKYLIYWQNLAMRCNYECVIEVFDTPVDECIRRDSMRKKPVGSEAIIQMYEKYIKSKIIEES